MCLVLTTPVHLQKGTDLMDHAVSVTMPDQSRCDFSIVPEMDRSNLSMLKCTVSSSAARERDGAAQLGRCSRLLQSSVRLISEY